MIVHSLQVRTAHDHYVLRSIIRLHAIQPSPLTPCCKVIDSTVEGLVRGLRLCRP